MIDHSSFLLRRCNRQTLRLLAMVFASLLLSSSTIRAESQASGKCNFHSDDQAVCFTSDFSGGRMNRCVQLGPEEFAITIEPESDPINDSAWYAFQVQSSEPRTVSVDLNYQGGTHRYPPKISRDGKVWEDAAHLVTHQHPLRTKVRMKVPVSKDPLWIAGQELLGTIQMKEWASKLAKLAFVKSSVIGESVEGRPIPRLDITQSDASDYVFIVARQHPPEVSGAIGMMHFVDAIADQSALAQEFRSRFKVVVVPTVNPDGVAHGHWRCNANGVDLNRDWLHFTQPETRAVGEQMIQCRQGDGRLCLFIDFHSTYEDVFYLPSPSVQQFPAGFTNRWLSALQRRFPKYPVKVDDTHNDHRTTSKAWVSETLGVTAVTYEFGDETDRSTIRRIANGASQEMMRLLLEIPKPAQHIAAAAHVE